MHSQSVNVAALVELAWQEVLLEVSNYSVQIMPLELSLLVVVLSTPALGSSYTPSRFVWRFAAPL